MTFGNGIIMKLKIIAINIYLCAIHGKRTNRNRATISGTLTYPKVVAYC